MCTLVIAAHVVPDHPLVVVANRDERKGRPSTPPFEWPGGFLAPRDEVAGGTWLGWNDRGVFVGITNRFAGPTSSADPTRKSRGAIVVEALQRGSAREIHATMARLDPAQYNGFHLVYVDERDVLATVGDGHTLAQLTLGHGVTIVTERSFGAGSPGDERRALRIRRAWSNLMVGPFDIDRATRLLTEHDAADPLAATCIHLDELDYGTRSAMVLDVGVGPGGGRRPRLLWAEGPPCTTSFQPIGAS